MTMDTHVNPGANKQNRCRFTLVIVRHGERLDYVQRSAGKNWCQANPEQPWNPPLTQKGLSMAINLGSALSRDILPGLGLPNVKAIYTSPFLRCLQTAAGISQGISSVGTKYKNSDSKIDLVSSPPLKVRVELGLAESINENWYRSWSLPGTDGTWGYKKKEIPQINPARDGMDPRARLPVEDLLDWKQKEADAHGILNGIIDHQYKPRTSLGGDYSFAGSQPNLETSRLQRKRVANTLNILINEQLLEQSFATNESTTGESEKTIVLVTHGGIVNQFYMNLTYSDSKNHGVGKYCCFSIYRSDEEPNSQCQSTEEEVIQRNKWTPLIVNRVLWDAGKDHD